MRIIFFGSSSFSVPILDRLLNDARFEIVLVASQPDKLSGRRQQLSSTEVANFARAHSLPLLQPSSLKKEEVFGALKSFTCDIGVVASYGLIIPQRILDLPKFGMVNVHPSLLPLYRGASPIASAIMAGETMTGITFIQMDALMDHGPVIASYTFPISNDDSQSYLEHRLGKLASDRLGDSLVSLVRGLIIPVEQDHSKATNTRLLTRDDGRIDWHKSAQQIERMIRAYDPWPQTFTEWKGKRLKIFSSKVGSEHRKLPGTCFVLNDFPFISCGARSSIQLLSVQLEAKSRMSGEAFLRGQSEWVRSILR